MTETFRISPFLIDSDTVRFKIERLVNNATKWGTTKWTRVDNDYFMTIGMAEGALKRLANPNWYLAQHPRRYYDHKGDPIHVQVD